MSVENIGKVINELRKEKKVTQEELANAVGVSTQAVSKWECGGSPDIELLPAIADFFGVSIDRLFDRNKNNYDGIEINVAKYIASTDKDKQYKTWFNLLWIIQRGLFGIEHVENNDCPLERINSENHEYAYSFNNAADGISWLSLLENQQYAFLMPRTKDYSKIILPVEEYQKLFEKLSDIDYLNCLFFLYKREENKDFTEKLFINNLNVSEEKAKELINFLSEYRLIHRKEVEIDDEIRSIYSFEVSTSFLPFLIFAKEMIRHPNNYYYYMGGDNNLIK